MRQGNISPTTSSMMNLPPSIPSVIILMADYGHDPTEIAVPFKAFREAGFLVDFATETGNRPECDKLMLAGWTQRLLGATKPTIELYHAMEIVPEFQVPLSWSDPSFASRLASYNLLYIPGGHHKGVRQLYDSDIARRLTASFFQLAEKASQKAVAAICHGVLLLSEAKLEKGPDSGKSPIHDARTTALPGAMESFAYHSTRCLLGDYYKTYGARSENVETLVKGRLDDPGSQWKTSLSTAPFVVEDQKYNYLSARFPGDADCLAERAISLVNQVKHN